MPLENCIVCDKYIATHTNFACTHPCWDIIAQYRDEDIDRFRSTEDVVYNKMILAKMFDRVGVDMEEARIILELGGLHDKAG